ncbi:MAG: carboxypeptidase-like regulatory domain-containing protein [Marinilabiliaceae bacterium]|nr:carboxypeptidase-like regulatory domain-containing protein [Marinilabiliaceae bacterium]
MAMNFDIHYLYSNRNTEKKQGSRNFIGLLILLLCASPALSNPIDGVIKDAKTKESIPFANVIIQNTTIGTITDLDGNFSLGSQSLPITITVSLMGYKSQEITIDNLNNPLVIHLEEDVFALNEVVVKPDNSYERAMLRKIIKSRSRNNPSNFKTLNYDDYTRTTVFLTNLNAATTQSKTFRKSADAFVKKNDSLVMMPFFMDETITHHIRDAESNIDESKKTSQKSDGILSESNTQVSSVLNSKLTTEFNFYDNQINVLTRGFPSPLSSTALLYYNIYLSDSTTTNAIKYYKFDFYPKSYKNITFKGHFWVEDKSWALTEIKATLPNSANLNFVSNLEVFITYKKTNTDRWFYHNQKINLQLTVRKNEKKKDTRRSFAVQKIMAYQAVKIGPDAPKQLVAKTHAGLKPDDEDVILKIRQQVAPLDTFEQSAYEGIQQLKANNFIKTVDRFSAMTLNGYYNVNKIDVGPYFAFYRKNEIEGNRITIPLRTSEKLFKNFMVGGYLGYGFKNKEWAQGGDVKYLLPSEKRTIISAGYHHDYFDLTHNRFVEFIRENPYSQGGGNIISSFTSEIPNPYMMKNKHLNLTLEHQLGKNTGLLIRPSYNRYYANYNLPFATRGVHMTHFDTYNLLFDVRLSFSQDYDEGFFTRFYYGNEKPVFHFTSLLGHYKLPEGDNNSGFYAHFNLSMKNRVNLGPAFMKILMEGGYILGDVPYPLLHLPRGTRDIGSARYHYNLLHHASFASDLYLNTHLYLNGGGILFNKLPLIKKLNLREAVTFKGYYGKLLGDPNTVMDMPDMLRKPTHEPYMEMGLGITNIFKVLRVEYVKRLNNGAAFNEFSSSHGVRFRIEVTF